jgi:endonuclease/exonuclease/phosphatase family metal-dependent hydrolase
MPAYTAIKRIKDDAERARIIERILALREHLDREIPAKTASDTLLLATWNIREFGNNRTDESLHYLAEIINRFDLVAIQEVAGNQAGLQRLVALLGHNWDYIVTDSTEGVLGGGERMAFVYDKCKVFFRKMAGELVMPQSKLIGDDKLQFARTPFSVAFQASWFRLVLTTVHIVYGENKADSTQRVKEIETLAAFIKDRAKKEDVSYILLGDFNIYNTGDKTMKALEKHGFYIPQAIREHPSDIAQTKHYDQMAFKLNLDDNMVVFNEKEQKAGTFDYTQTIYTDDDLEIYRPYFDAKQLEKSEAEIKKYYQKTWRTFQISDHLPLWIELRVDFSDQYLEKIK